MMSNFAELSHKIVLANLWAVFEDTQRYSLTSLVPLTSLIPRPSHHMVERPGNEVTLWFAQIFSPHLVLGKN